MFYLFSVSYTHLVTAARRKQTMKKVRITVLRKEFYSDFADEYLTDGREAGPCALMNVGDSFIFEGGAQMPEGLCPWAWIDIYHSVSLSLIHI